MTLLQIKLYKLQWATIPNYSNLLLSYVNSRSIYIQLI